METKFTIKNFRVFDEDGVSLQLSPITILTGCNSAGKSSVVKAVTLLNSFLQQIKYDKDKGRDIVLSNYKIDFTEYPNTLLGGMDKVLHRDSNSSSITFEYTVHSCMLFKDVTVSLSFGIDTNDEIKNGYLQRLEVRTMDDKIIYHSSSADGSHYNMNLIKDTFLDFVTLEFLTHNFCGLESEYEFSRNISKSEYEKQRKEHIDAMRGYDKNVRHDVFSYVRSKYSANEAIAGKIDGRVVDWTERNNSFFYIPVVEHLSGLPKDKVGDAVCELLKGDCNSGERFAINRVIANFMESSSSSLGEYFHSLENGYLEDVLFNGANSPIVSSLSLPHHIQWQPLAITMNPKDTVWTYVKLDDEQTSCDDDRAAEIEKWEKQPINFLYVYEAMMLLNAQYAETPNKEFYHTDEFLGYYSHRIFEIFERYACNVIEEVLLPDWCGTISYVSTSRMEMQRLYVLDSRNDFCRMLKNYLEAKRNYQQSSHREEYEPDTFMNKWISRLGIGHSITIEREQEGYGMYIRLHKQEGDKGVVLADEGYGVTQLAAILIPIETVILSNLGKQVNQYYGLSSLDGYDDSKFHYAQRTIAVEEPEIHLHPQYQSLLADMFAEAAEKYNIHFIVETHSEYLIRKLQLLTVGKAGDLKIDRNDVTLCYIDHDDNQNSSDIRQIGICKNGYLDEEFGSGFYDEAVTLSRSLR